MGVKKRQLEQALRAAVGTLDNIDYLVSKQGDTDFQLLLRGIKTELATGAYEDAQWLLSEIDLDRVLNDC